MALKEIIKKYLQDHGYDGLVNTSDDCGCSVDDLGPCGCINVYECEPAYRKTCAECGNTSCDDWDGADGGCFYAANHALKYHQDKVCLDGWIRVEDRSPEKSGMYRVYDGFDVWMCEYNNGWVGGDPHAMGLITHWSTIPNSSEER